AHLRALPHRWLCVRGLCAGGLRGRRVLLPLSPPQAGAVGGGRGRGPSPGDHPHDGQRGHLQGLLLPPVQHRHLLQLLGPGGSPPARPPADNARPGVLLRPGGRQRLRQHAHQLLGSQLPAGHPDHAPPGTVPPPAVHRLRPPRHVPGRRLHGPQPPGGLPPAAVPLPPAHQCGEHGG
ncbi:unnamed protein product, partial [Arctogadus glacialis]